MKTTPTKIRPRLRVAEAAPRYNDSLGIPQTVDQPATVEDATPPLRVLARLPEVTLPADQSKISLPLDWLKNLDWQHVRRIKLDPNWVAGGVLSLVLVLLLVITFNRNSKSAAEPPSTDEAPAWNTAGKTPSNLSPETGLAPPSAVDVGPYVTGNTASNQTQGGHNASSSTDAAVRQFAAQNASSATTSLDGISYPRTPYPEVATQPVIVHQNAGQQFPEVRTAQRDLLPRYQPAVQGTSPPSDQARLEGIITRPQ
jgi:hypothetical protein